MYKIIGADQKEYGPVTADEIRKWIVEGRANDQTLVQTEGGPWKPLASFPELGAHLPPAPPSVTPPPPGAPPTFAPSSSADAARAVSAPAVCLIVTAILGMLNSAVGVVLNLTGVRFPGLDLPREPRFAEFERFFEMLGGTMGTISGLISLAVGAFILVGAFKMMKLRSYGMAVAASIIAMIPCVSPCCCLGLPFGIWALVVLSRREVKSAFE
jgi:hypothetical protein